jgi:shikimate kinase/3-dehydroquinate synthase
MRRGVALGGFMGAGKSTVGRKLAARLGLPFADTDEILAARFGPIPTQLARDGEPAFRARERAVIAELADGVPRVVATGGGAWVDPANRDALRRDHRLVVLTAPLDVLRGRVGAGVDRPFWGQADVLLAARAGAYADAERTIDTAAADADDVVAQLAAWLAEDGKCCNETPGLREARAARASAGEVGDAVVRVVLGDRSYDVVLARGLAGLGAAVRGVFPRVRRVALVVDATVDGFWGDVAAAALGGLATTRLQLPAGEEHKTVATWSALVDGLLAAGLDRRTPVVALGGGVTGDIAGFAAASVLRGLPLVQVPTTLLAMVDSSVGGKTAVNHPVGKNLVGAFHQPSLVYAALDTLRTLPPRELRAGLAEVVKTAVLGDADLLARLEADAERLAAGDPDALAPVIARCVAIKGDVVARDEREADVRAILNYGHTVGHGLENALGYGVLLHGEAVAVGMSCETRWAVRTGHCADAALPARIEALLTKLGLPTSVSGVPRDAALIAMRADKKADGYTVRVPVPAAVGRMVLVDVAIDALPDLLWDLPP